jgi:hypothetical protein
MEGILERSGFPKGGIRKEIYWPANEPASPPEVPPLKTSHGY